MIRLLFLGDGVRDEAMVPSLVSQLLRVDVERRFEPWARLSRAGTGYDRKLMFAMRQARATACDGVVATIDQDKSRGRERLKSLVAGRTRDREMQASLPAALGCADPHAEAWLLDDPVAVREVLELPPATPVPNVSKVQNPKTELERLHTGSPRSGDQPRAICAEIAARLDPTRCAHAEATGLSAFVEDVRAELDPLAAASRPRG